jgi:hypothetical protein
MYDAVEITRRLIFGTNDPLFYDYNAHIRPDDAKPDTQIVAWVDARKPADKVIVEALDLRESFWSWVSSLNPRYHYSICSVLGFLI